MATDTREDAGQYYPGGDVIPTRPMPSGGGGTIVLDDTVTQSSSNGVKSSGIWTWVKGLLPSWLTSSYAEPATVASVNQKYTKPSDGIPSTDMTSAVQTALTNARTPTEHASTHATNGSDQITPADIGVTMAVGTQNVAMTVGTSVAVIPRNDFMIQLWNSKYSKPSGGIPKADLASSVQTSLDKADTAIQSHQDISGKLSTTKYVEGQTASTIVWTNDGKLDIAAPNIVVGESLTISSGGIEANGDVTSYVGSTTHALSGKANVSDFSLPQGGGSPSAPYVSSLFSRDDTSTEIEIDGLLKNAELEKSVKVCAQKYGGTQIKQDDQGNFYYEVEE